MQIMLLFPIALKMIFFISDGRLGNQLFQYSYLNTIAHEKERILCVNMQSLRENFDYNQETWIFLKSSKIRNLFYKNIFIKFLSILVSLKIIGCVQQLVTETSSLAEVNMIRGIFPFSYVKTGFFQTEKLLNTHRINIKIKDIFIQNANRIFNKLPNKEKVFIHIRRGDYIFEAYLGRRDISLPRSYFTKAMSLIEKDLENPFYIILTDDPSYAECCFNDVENKYISNEDMTTDLALMSLCRYGITSNSSFSWWGAYFSKEKKTMIFPDYWYGWKEKVQSHIDIQPSWGVTIDPADKEKKHDK